jgi:hypothetical protein
MSDYQASKDFAYCLNFAMKVAESRGSLTLDLRDLLAGLFIADLEKLSKFWHNWEDFESLVAAECEVREPRIFYWIRAYNQAYGVEKGAPPKWALFKDQSIELAKVWVTASQIADSRGGPTPGQRPFLAPEDFLLAIIRHQETALGQKLAASGLDVGRLEQAVKTVKPLPG